MLDATINGQLALHQDFEQFQEFQGPNPRWFHGVRWKVGGNWDQVTIGTKQQVLRDCS